MSRTHQGLNTKMKIDPEPVSSLVDTTMKSRSIHTDEHSFISLHDNDNRIVKKCIFTTVERRTGHTSLFEMIKIL